MRIKRVVPTALVVAVAGFGIAGATIASASGTNASAAASPTVSLKSTSLGKILVNSKGDTLYLWEKDKKGSGKTACTTACQAVWPLVTVSRFATAGAGVNKKLLGTIKVGSKTEVTYNGWPLYTFVSDTKPGDTKGQGNTSFGAPWYVVSASGNAITKK